jgi:hypothetical protein
VEWAALKSKQLRWVAMTLFPKSSLSALDQYTMYPQWRCYTYYFFVNKSDGYVQLAIRISRVLRRIMDFHMGD